MDTGRYSDHLLSFKPVAYIAGAIFIYTVSVVSMKNFRTNFYFLNFQKWYSFHQFLFCLFPLQPPCSPMGIYYLFDQYLNCLKHEQFGQLQRKFSKQAHLQSRAVCPFGIYIQSTMQGEGQFCLLQLTFTLVESGLPRSTHQPELDQSVLHFELFCSILGHTRFFRLSYSQYNLETYSQQLALLVAWLQVNFPYLILFILNCFPVLFFFFFY